MKAYFIDSFNERITEVEFQTLADIRKYIGGFLELAYSMPNGDHVYVDEEGLVKGYEKGFFIQRIGKFHASHQAFAGNGLYLGAEKCEDEYAEGNMNHDPDVTLEELQRAILWHY